MLGGSAVIRGGRWLRDGNWWTAVAGGAIAFPIGVLLHELGHFAAYSAFEFPDLVLRYAFVSWDSGGFRALWLAGDLEAASAIAAPWQVAVGAAAGPIVSYLLVVGCVLAVRRYGAETPSVVVGVGLGTPLRWLVAFPVLASKLRGERLTSNTDEGWVAMITGIPETLLFLPGLACLVLGYWFLVRAIPRGQRVRVLVATSAGLVLGGIVWAQWLGPLLLP